MPESLSIYTIGHSTRTTEEFLALLNAHGIRILADVRRFPMSRRHPHFNADALRAQLATHGIGYLAMTELGGRRPTQPNSPNVGWKNDGFRGYADYMGTREFTDAIKTLLGIAKSERSAIMCAEALPWQCHRNLIADALVMLHGCDVRHIMSEAEARVHTPASFAIVRDGVVRYPADDLLAGA